MCYYPTIRALCGCVFAGLNSACESDTWTGLQQRWISSAHRCTAYQHNVTMSVAARKVPISAARASPRHSLHGPPFGQVTYEGPRAGNIQVLPAGYPNLSDLCDQFVIGPLSPAPHSFPHALLMGVVPLALAMH